MDLLQTFRPPENDCDLAKIFVSVKWFEGLGIYLENQLTPLFLDPWVMFKVGLLVLIFLGCPRGKRDSFYTTVTFPPLTVIETQQALFENQRCRLVPSSLTRSSRLNLLSPLSQGMKYFCL